MGGKSSTTTTTTKPPKEVMAAYNDLLAQAKPISQTPYQPYTGGVNGSGFEQNQEQAFNTFGNLAGSQDQNFANAASALNASTTPTYQSVNQYMSPYIQDVVNATTANMAEQNAQQQQGVLGNAAAQGALGGNRVGVAQSELARQQNLANQSTIANLYNQGYNTALGAAQAQQAAEQGAASGYTNLGQSAMQTNLAQAVSQLGAGTQQQNFLYQQYQNARSYPFETTSWLANIVEGLGSGMGGTQTQTSPAGNTGSGILGGLLSLASVIPWARGGAVHADGRPHRAQGGVIPYTSPSGIMPMNNNQPGAANDNDSYVPQAATGTAGKSTMPNASASPASQNSGSQMLQQGIGAMENKLKQKYPNGVLAGFQAPQTPTTGIPDLSSKLPSDLGSTAAAAAANAPTGPVADAGLLSKLGGLFGLAHGGVVRGYDAGGYVDDFDPLNDPVIVPQTPPDPVVTPTTDRLPAPDPSRFAPATEPPLGAVTMPFSPDTSVPDLPAPREIADIPVASIPEQAYAPQTSGVVTPFPTAKGVVADKRPVLNPIQTQGDPIYLPGQNYGSATPAAKGSSGIVPASTGANNGGARFSTLNANAGLPDGYLNTTAYIESRFNPQANNGVAKGEFQFTPPTARQYGLTNPFDPNASAIAAARLGADNAKFLAGGLGRAPSGGELYLAHQQGANGALNLLTHPNAMATDIIGRAAVVQNGGTPDMTAGQFANMWISNYNSANAKVNGAQSAIGRNLLDDGVDRVTPGMNPQQAQEMMDDGVDRTPNIPNAQSYVTPVSQSSGTPSDTNYPTTNVTNQGVVPSVRGDQTPHGGVLSGLLHGQGLHLTDDQRFALLQAGLGMMAGTSPNFLTNVGTGGLKGAEAYQQRQQLNRENALAQSEINTRQGELGLEGKRVDIAGGQLALEAKKTAQDIAASQTQQGLIGTETAAKRYQQTLTPAGIIVRDITQPLAPPHLITWSELQNGSTIPGAGETSAPNGGSRSPSTNQSAAPSTNTSAAQNAPVTAAPISPEGARPVADHTNPAEGFITTPPANIPINGMVFNPMGQEVARDQAVKGVEQARNDYQAGQAMKVQLDMMKDAAHSLPDTGFLSRGAGASARAAIAKNVNTALQTAGIQPWFDPNAVGSYEELNKLATRFGFDLARTLGSREAASIVSQAQSAVPSGENTKQGFERIVAGIEAMTQRQSDYYTAMQKWQQQSGGDISGFDNWFNAMNPPEKYAKAAVLSTAVVPKTQADIDNAPAGTVFNVNGQLLVK